MAAHREQAEQHLEAPQVEALLVEVLEGQRELEVLQAQVGLPEPELLRVRLERSLEQFLPWAPRLPERELSEWLELRW